MWYDYIERVEFVGVFLGFWGLIVGVVVDYRVFGFVYSYIMVF